MEPKRPAHRPDITSEGHDNNDNAALKPLAGQPDARAAALTDLKAGEPRETDEAGDTSLQNAEHPTLVHEDVGNTSTSSGTHAGDEGDDQMRKELLRRGAREVSRMD